MNQPIFTQSPTAPETAVFQTPPRERQSIVVAMREAHRKLGEDLRRLELALKPDAAPDLPALRASLAATYTHVCNHFHTEERGGYMNEIRQREPRLEIVIQGLENEHRFLRQTLDDLLAKTRLTTHWDDAFRTEARDWLRRLHQHEAKETDVVQNAFNFDLTGED